MENTLVLSNSNCYPEVFLPPPSQFEAYARAANSMPMLSEDAEADLLKRWADSKDKEAARQLVLSHLRLVVKVVRSHNGYGVSSGDLAQEGTVGLMKAVHRFRSDVGVRLATFALRWIEAEVREFIFRSWRLVRLGSGAAMRKLFFNYRKTLSSLRKMDPDRKAGVTNSEIAKAIGVSEDQVAQVSGYFRGQDMSLSYDKDEDVEHETQSSERLKLLIQDSDENRDPQHLVMNTNDQEVFRRALASAWSKLNEKEARILLARRLTEPSIGLKELGKELNISAERVRQIEQAAFKKLSKLAVESLQ